ncbi:MAG: sugar ABC transporter permease [Bifidobacteriaceae bacterium]|jgi:arabinogalactan oligomer/maltooligosaccharide transport system permease protein|nr:sugar ABC transporter permease [Bifidobacteriaceae bacterium]
MTATAVQAASSPPPKAGRETRPVRSAPDVNAGRRAVQASWRYLIAAVALVFALFPIVFIISASLNPLGSLTSSNALFSAVDAGSYVDLLSDPAHPYARWFGNSMMIGGVTAVATVFLGACAAYAFSRFRFKGRRGGLLTLILLQMFPQTLAYVAIFLLLTTLKDVFPILGLDSQIGLIMVYLGGALGVNTYLMYGFFSSVPMSIDESAKIDGASHARVFFSIILRLVAPILAVVALLSFIGTLNDFVIASVVLTTPGKQTLAVGLYQFISQNFSQNWGVFAAGAVLAAIPVVLIFLFLQKYIVSGLTAGAVKG